MSRKVRILFNLSVICLLSGCSSAQQLTRSGAKDILNKLAAAQPVNVFTFNMDQAKKMMQSIKQPSDADIFKTVFAMKNPAKSCIPDASDVRVATGQLILCPMPVPAGITWQSAGSVTELKTPMHWSVVEVTGITGPSDNSTDRSVEFTWSYDLSSFPKALRDMFTIPPSPGKALI